LGVLYGGLGIGKLQFDKKNLIFFSCNFFQFLVIKALDPDWIRIGIHPKILDPDEMNADLQTCLPQRAEKTKRKGRRQALGLCLTGVGGWGLKR
jgi:hypothetical protein